MKTSTWVYSSIFAITATAMTIGFTNCSGGDAFQTQSGILASGGTLAITPTTVNLTAGQTTTFVASGGSGVYSYFLYGGTGKINVTSGIYTAPVAMETDTIQVIDSNGTQAFATAIIGTTSSTTSSGSLAISPSSVSVLPSSTTSFSASGGAGTYTFSMFSGSGTITTYGYYTAPTAAETDYIMVTDSSGGTAYGTITVTSSTSMPTTEIYAFTANSLGDHYYSTSSSAPSGYTFQKNAFKLFSTNVNSGTVALYSCRRSSNGVHFLSTTLGCSGQTTLATLGYLYQYGTINFVPLYGYISSNSVDTIDTVLSSDGAGYLYEGVLGYVGSP